MALGHKSFLERSKDVLSAGAQKVRSNIGKVFAGVGLLAAAGAALSTCDHDKAQQQTIATLSSPIQPKIENVENVKPQAEPVTEEARVEAATPALKTKPTIASLGATCVTVTKDSKHEIGVDAFFGTKKAFQRGEKILAECKGEEFEIVPPSSYRDTLFVGKQYAAIDTANYEAATKNTAIDTPAITEQASVITPAAPTITASAETSTTPTDDGPGTRNVFADIFFTLEQQAAAAERAGNEAIHASSTALVDTVQTIREEGSRLLDEGGVQFERIAGTISSLADELTRAIERHTSHSGSVGEAAATAPGNVPSTPAKTPQSDVSMIAQRERAKESTTQQTTERVVERFEVNLSLLRPQARPQVEEKVSAAEKRSHAHENIVKKTLEAASLRSAEYRLTPAFFARLETALAALRDDPASRALTATAFDKKATEIRQALTREMYSTMTAEEFYAHVPTEKVKKGGKVVEYVRNGLLARAMGIKLKAISANANFLNTPIPYTTDGQTFGSINEASLTRITDELVAKSGRKLDGAQMGLLRNLVNALTMIESKGDPATVSATYCIGMRQLASDNYAPGRHRAAINPYNAAENIHRGNEVLMDMLRTYNWRLTEALTAYNAGPTKVRFAKEQFAQYGKKVGGEYGDFRDYIAEKEHREYAAKVIRAMHDKPWARQTANENVSPTSDVHTEAQVAVVAEVSTTINAKIDEPANDNAIKEAEMADFSTDARAVRPELFSAKTRAIYDIVNALNDETLSHPLSLRKSGLHILFTSLTHALETQNAKEVGRLTAEIVADTQKLSLAIEHDADHRDRREARAAVGFITSGVRSAA